MGVASGTDVAARPSAGAPFPVGPEHVVVHRGWAEARDRALSAVRAGRGLILVVGAPGTGKTLLLHILARTLRAAGTDVILQSRGDLPVHAAEFGQGGAGARRRRVVLIDEADRMNEAALQHLGRLGTCALVLAGMPDPGADSGYERSGRPFTAATVVRLAALSPDEVGAFVAARLTQSGLRPDLLSEDAVAQLARHSGGMPRVLNTLAGAALFLARSERASRVEAAHVDQAAALRDGNGIDPVGSAIPIMPGVVPIRQPDLPDAPAAACLAAAASQPMTAGSKPAQRRWRAAALGLTTGIAAACVGAVAWHGGHARHKPPLVTAGQPSPAPSVSIASLPQGVAASSRAMAIAAPSRAMPVTAPVPASAKQPMPEALPSGAPAHVLLRYARGSADAAAWAASLAVALRGAGIAVDALVPVAEQDARPGARYFFAEDQGAADAALRAVGLAGKGTLVDARGLNAVLRPGLIELTVLPGQLQVGNRRPALGDGRS